MPIACYGRSGYGMIAHECAIRLPEPFSERAIIVAPDDVIAVVAIEVTRSDHVPAGGDIGPRAIVEPAVRSSKPIPD